MSDIEWTDKTWNPVVGCSLASPGCALCYAGTMARRQVAMAAAAGRVSPYADVVRVAEPGQKARTGAAAWNGQVAFLPERLAEPLRWRNGARIFVNSMSDLFHERLSFDAIAAVFGVMASTPQHTFQVLTKRPARMLRFLLTARVLGLSEVACDYLKAAGVPLSDDAVRSPSSNIWLGVSVEDQPRADERLPLLAEVRAMGWHTFASVEPLIGRVAMPRANLWESAEWVIIGGESGPHSRRCEADWIREVRHDAQAAGAAVFIKQLGLAFSDPLHGVAGAGLRVDSDAHVTRRLVNRKGADPAEWPEDLRVRDWPAAMVGS